jgi:hypothetical protein
MPKLDFAFLADAAEAEPGRKFYVLGGGIDSINAATFPVVHPHLSLVMRILIHPTETGRDHGIEIRMIDQDGGQVMRLDGNLSASPAMPGAGREIAMNMVVNMVSTRFERAGDHSIEILIDGQHAKSVPLRLQQLTGPPPGHPG